jgi:hypothetical protein
MNGFSASPKPPVKAALWATSLQRFDNSVTNPAWVICSVVEELGAPFWANIFYFTEITAMKLVLALLLGCICIVPMTMVFGGNSSKQADGPQTVTGEITDTLCAAYKSHDHMMEQMKSMGTDKASCIQQCLQVGAKYSLYDAGQQKAYKIENPDKVASFAGRKVRVSGEVQKDKLKVEQIEAIQ